MRAFRNGFANYSLLDNPFEDFIVWNKIPALNVCDLTKALLMILLVSNYDFEITTVYRLVEICMDAHPKYLL